MASYSWRLTTLGSYNWISVFLSYCSSVTLGLGATTATTQCSWCHSGSTTCGRRYDCTNYGSYRPNGSCNRECTSATFSGYSQRLSGNNYAAPCFGNGATHGHHESSDCNANNTSGDYCRTTASGTSVSWYGSDACTANTTVSCSNYLAGDWACSSFGSTDLYPTTGFLCRHCGTNTAKADSSPTRNSWTTYATTTDDCVTT